MKHSLMKHSCRLTCLCVVLFLASGCTTDRTSNIQIYGYPVMTTTDADGAVVDGLSTRFAEQPAVSTPPHDTTPLTKTGAIRGLCAGRQCYPILASGGQGVGSGTSREEFCIILTANCIYKLPKADLPPGKIVWRQDKTYVIIGRLGGTISIPRYSRDMEGLRIPTLHAESVSTIP
jgi:hypothetical protein